jgi:hypothetical protein
MISLDGKQGQDARYSIRLFTHRHRHVSVLTVQSADRPLTASVAASRKDANQIWPADTAVAIARDHQICHIRRQLEVQKEPGNFDVIGVELIPSDWSRCGVTSPGRILWWWNPAIFQFTLLSWLTSRQSALPGGVRFRPTPKVAPGRDWTSFSQNTRRRAGFFGVLTLDIFLPDPQNSKSVPQDRALFQIQRLADVKGGLHCFVGKPIRLGTIGKASPPTKART